MFFHPFFDFDDSGYGPQAGSYYQRGEDVNNSRLYEVLGVPKNATDAQIRKAYLVKAKQMHPDKGGNPVEFQNLSTAYDILSDAEKRAMYDQYGESYINGTVAADPSIVRRTRVPKKTKDIRKKIVCSLEDLYNGKNVKMRITHKVVCKQCKGDGGKPGYMYPCQYCNGKGVTYVEVSDFLFQRQMKVECQYCHGKGVKFNQALQCPVCRGERLVQEYKNADIYLERGMGTGSVIRIHEAADEAPGLASGDVLLVVQERDHNVFERNGPDLRMHMTITVGEMLCGFVKSFQHLDGRTVFVRCGPCEVRPNAVKILRGEGMPLEGDIMKRGSLFIVFDVEYPRNLTNEQLQALRSVFNVPLPVVPETDVADLKPVNPEEYGKSVPGYVPKKEVYEEDEPQNNEGYTECPFQ